MKKIIKNVFIILLLNITVLIGFGLIFEMALRVTYWDAETPPFIRKKAGNNLLQQHNDHECSWSKTLYPHPYLGFIQGGKQKCRLEKVNNQGVYGEPYPQKNNPEYFDILVLGGSVAFQMMSGHPSHRIPLLKKHIEENYYGPEGREIRVYNGSVGAWKQPQQLIQYLLHQEKFDGILSVEGFNEFSIDRRVSLDTPFAIAFIPFKLPDLMSPIYFYLNEMVARIRLMLDFSYSAHWLEHRVTNVLNIRATREFEKTFMHSVFSLPNNRSSREYLQDKILKYTNYLRSLKAVTNIHNQKLAIFMQPILAKYKPIHENEKAFLFNSLDTIDSYEKAINYFKTFQELPVFSLLELFKSEPRQIYSDYIHMKFDSNGMSLGYEKLSQEIGQTLLLNWGLQKKQ